ncbi:MAG: hypothetical protein ACOC44_01085 [Promethearchaeia archaeon]
MKRLIKEGKKFPKVAITAGARKLATYIFHILKKQIPFEEMFDLRDSEWHEKAKKRKMASVRNRYFLLPFLNRSLGLLLFENN